MYFSNNAILVDFCCIREPLAKVYDGSRAAKHSVFFFNVMITALTIITFHRRTRLFHKCPLDTRRGSSMQPANHMLTW